MNIKSRKLALKESKKKMNRQHRTESVNLLYCNIVTQYNTLHETISHDP
jgi:hypothetical protein